MTDLLSKERLEVLRDTFIDMANETTDKLEYEGWSDAAKVIDETLQRREAAEKAITCWSCKKKMTASERMEADGFCPHCDAEIELEDDTTPLTSAERERLAHLESQNEYLRTIAHEQNEIAIKANLESTNTSVLLGALHIRTAELEERLAAYDRAAKEPVGYAPVSSIELLSRATIVEIDVSKQQRFSDHIPLFTAPPLPVVPDEIPREKHNDGVAFKKDGIIYSPSYATGWNACRAAMLQLSGNSEQVNSQVIPEGWALVPENLTTEMRNAWDSAPMSDDDSQNMRDAYRAMLYAAPQPGKVE